MGDIVPICAVSSSRFQMRASQRSQRGRRVVVDSGC
jgi:hypothetical protein